jgi:hypothetical protein
MDGRCARTKKHLRKKDAVHYCYLHLLVLRKTKSLVAICRGPSIQTSFSSIYRMSVRL